MLTLLGLTPRILSKTSRVVKFMMHQRPTVGCWPSSRCFQLNERDVLGRSLVALSTAKC